MNFREYRGITRDKKMVFGSLIYDDPFCVIRVNKDLCYDVLPETVGQWTGCYDKNGTKIFEGDIIKYGGYLHTVEFYAPHYEGVRLARDYSYIMLKHDDGVVVGNIYEDRWMTDLVQ